MAFPKVFARLAVHCTEAGQRGALIIGIAGMTAMTLIHPSVWSMVAGGLGAAAKPLLMSRFLPGRRNALRCESEAGRALIHFGKWIFLSTAFGFVIAQGRAAGRADRVHADRGGSARSAGGSGASSRGVGRAVRSGLSRSDHSGGHSRHRPARRDAGHDRGLSRAVGSFEFSQRSKQWPLPVATSSRHRGHLAAGVSG